MEHSHGHTDCQAEVYTETDTQTDRQAAGGWEIDRYLGYGLQSTMWMHLLLFRERATLIHLRSCAGSISVLLVSASISICHGCLAFETIPDLRKNRTAAETNGVQCEIPVEWIWSDMDRRKRLMDRPSTCRSSVNYGDLVPGDAHVMRLCCFMVLIAVGCLLVSA